MRPAARFAVVGCIWGLLAPRPAGAAEAVRYARANAARPAGAPQPGGYAGISALRPGGAPQPGGYGRIGAQRPALPALSGRWARIDAWALTTPRSAEKSLEFLAAYLVRPATNDAEKARAIFRWLTANISYNAARARAHVLNDLSPEEALRKRTCLCAGYAGLFERMARSVGMQATTIEGLGKGFNFEIGSPLPTVNTHAWNAVKINGRWRLLDATWGAGYQDDSGNFVRRFCEHYFLTNPVEFVLDHLPEDPNWQLLPHPLSREAFAQLAYLKPAFFVHHLRILSHPFSMIRAQGSTAISLWAPSTVAVTAKVLLGDTPLPDALALTQREGDQVVTRAVFPQAGAYTVRLFAKERGKPGPYEWAVEYRIAAAKGQPPPAGYPRVLSAFYDHAATVGRPLALRLRAGKPQQFALRVPGVEEVAVVCGHVPTRLTKEGDVFSGTVTPLAGDVSVCARNDLNTNRYEVLLVYKAE